MSSQPPFLPSELVDHILYFITGGHPSSIPMSDRFTKAELSSCALTCRYWSRRCRKHIFDSITLSSQEDLYMLTGLVSLPFGKHDIANLITRLTVEQGDSCTPWAHNVPRLLAHRLPALAHFSYANSPFADAGAIILHPHMARIFPAYVASSGWDITVLELRNQRYTSFADMARVIGSLYRLTTLRCNKVSWRTIPPFPGRPPMRAGPHLLSIEVRECDAYWPFIWFMTSACRTASRLCIPSSIADVVPGFKPVEAWLINSVVRAYLSTLAPGQSEVAFSCRRSRTSLISEGFLMIEAQYATDAGPYLSFDFVTRRASLYGASATFDLGLITEVTFYDLDKGLSSKAVLSAPWQELDALLSSFPHLRLVTLTFDRPCCWSSRRLRRTCIAIGEAMWDLRASCKLGFRYGEVESSQYDDLATAWTNGGDEEDNGSASEADSDIDALEAARGSGTVKDMSQSEERISRSSLTLEGERRANPLYPTALGTSTQVQDHIELPAEDHSVPFPDEEWIKCSTCHKPGLPCRFHDTRHCSDCHVRFIVHDGLGRYQADRERMVSRAFQVIALINSQQ